MSLKKNNIFLYGVTIVFLVLFIIALYRLLAGSTQILSFQGLLNVLQNTPQINVHALTISEIGGNWLVLEPLRWFINTISPIVNVLTFIFLNEINCIAVIFYLLANLFLIV